LTPERWAQIEQLFHSAAECGGEERTLLLDKACSNDAELRREVEALLSCDASAGEYVQAAVRAEIGTVGFPLAGETISHYRILDGLGGGGMGLVYRAEDIKLGRQVALKFLPEESANDPASLARFEREARSASALEHPNICPIYEFGEHEGRTFLVMQLLEGQTLRELLESSKSETSQSDSSVKSPGRQALALDQVLNLAIQIANGLDAAHQKGIIHRDIKPANVFVTSQGQAKILDFGLAKLVRGPREEVDEPEREGRDDRSTRQAREVSPLPTPDPLLSRTGVAMGTAGYMSPEQVRGEKLDARTDLFSFGLVLYEMATGHRAFEGDTGPELHAAILNQTSTSARKLNPKVPAKLDEIIRKSLEKEREQRYHSAAELRTDLETLQRHNLPKALSSRWWAAAVAVIASLLLAAVFWYRMRPPAIVPDLKLRQLTFNSSENPVTAGSISPDGKYLAYSDAKGIHIKLVGTEETRSVPQPEALKNDRVAWAIDSNTWFPDSTRFLASTHPANESPGSSSSQTLWSSQASTIWMVSVQGGAPRKIRDHAVAWSVSRDGSSISFGANPGKLGTREIWLMTQTGDQAHKLYEVGENSAICCLNFSPSGDSFIYVRTDDSGDTLLRGDPQGRTPITILPPSTMKAMADFEWLPDGRLIYAVNEIAFADSCNYWAMRLDARTGQPLEKARRLTNWAGFCEDTINVTADGKHLTFRKWSSYDTTYVADLRPDGTGFLTTRRLTLSTSLDAPSSWTADSKAVILGSNRNGQWGLYKQALDEDEPAPLVTGPESSFNPVVSPDGKWVLYQQEVKPGDPVTPMQIMRVPLTGGTSQLVFAARHGGAISCARAPSKLCVIQETTEDSKQRIVTAFDPLAGRGAELARFDVDPSDIDPHQPAGPLSPDGTRIAALRGGRALGIITILSLRGGSTHVIKARGWNNLQVLDWAANGKSLFVLTGTYPKLAILNVDMHGNAHLLRDNVRDSNLPASPDGRHLAFMSENEDSNMWMMENF
jgi:eukaryotic-like serine/threonine-protein kinase